MKSKILTKEQISHAIANTKSMQSAARFLKCSYSVFRRHAIQYNIFNPNPSGKGTYKGTKFKSANDVFVKGKFVSSTALRRWYLRQKEYKCDSCNLKTWQEKEIVIELDHINGDRYDNRIENLRLLCPNCHSQTDNYKSKNKKRYECGSPTNRSTKYNFKDKTVLPV